MRIAPILPLAFLAACQQAPDPRGVARDETLLTVGATGRAETRPDEARIQLGVQSLGANGGEASRANNDKMAKVSAALTALGIKPDDLQTRNLTLQRIDYGKDRGRFRADNVVEVRLRDMSKVGQAIAAATDAGANVLSGPELRVSDREAANRSAYAAAYRAAKSRAEAYAVAADLKIARVLAIRDGGEAGAPIPYERDAMMSAAPSIEAGNAPPFNPGLNTSEVRVRVDFALDAK